MDKSTVEEIRHAAVKSESGWIFIGKCHADCFHKMHHMRIKSSQKAEHQGFVTSTGRYVGRHEGYMIALAAKQIEEFKGEELDSDIFDTGPTTRAKILFSEDLWSDQYRGQHNYSEIQGYTKKEIQKIIVTDMRQVGATLEVDMSIPVVMAVDEILINIKP